MPEALGRVLAVAAMLFTVAAIAVWFGVILARSLRGRKPLDGEGGAAKRRRREDLRIFFRIAVLMAIAAAGCLLWMRYFPDGI